MASSNNRKSKFSPATNRRRNTKAGREKMAPSQFALPDQKKYRIDDAAHARNALARVAQNGTPQEQAKVKRAVKAKYPSIGADSSKASKSSTSKRDGKFKTGTAKAKQNGAKGGTKSSRKGVKNGQSKVTPGK